MGSSQPPVSSMSDVSGSLEVSEEPARAGEQDVENVPVAPAAVGNGIELRNYAAPDEENQNRHGERDDANAPLLGGEDGTAGTAVQQERAPESMAQMEINSLMWIKRAGNEEYRLALETWQKKDSLFASRIDKKKEQSSSLRNEIYQLVGFYSVFQGVLLTAVAQSNLLVCHNWWTTFFLSLLASLAFVAGVILKFLSVLELEKTIGSEEISRKECIRRVNLLIRKREKFSMETDTVEKSTRVPDQKWLVVSAGLVVAVLLLFSGLFLASIIQILCDTGAPPNSSPNLI